MRYKAISPLTPQETLERAIAHFGPQGVGLEIVDQNNACLIFEGGGGHVAVTACPDESHGKKTTVKLETREWDYTTQKFMASIA